MVKVKIGNAIVELNKNEAKEVDRLKSRFDYANPDDKEYAQRAADIWMRSAPTGTAKTRRQAAVKALGLSDEVTFK